MENERCSINANNVRKLNQTIHKDKKSYYATIWLELNVCDRRYCAGYSLLLVF